ncbi:hypothetical protein [Borrelia venezuelensis]|uniref:hypothetical protein n=1 Tax=Borrelia venezuelensis TaxID=1653839 RepID=UPI001FF3A8EE|nr:hypothetical protein [Borrelia venezuelensis]UPA12837.1 hypothetical protein bvRMA01_001183 [Borrelia venezuelensis]UPA12867.1 hypothetical protein bvRMA01_001215 [Borrelia venezuelensis]
MRIFLSSCVFFIFIFLLSCSTILLYESGEGYNLDLLALKALMIYPELRISKSDLSKYTNFNDSNCSFDIWKGEQKGSVYISESSYNNNIAYIKSLYLYNKRLYKVILAYSVVQGLSFKSEVLRYLDDHNIKEKFPLRINFPYYKIDVDNRSWIVLKKDFLDMIIQDKNALIFAKRKLENILKSFSKQ